MVTLNTNSDFGLIGLGTMGVSLARNVHSRGFSVSTYNRSPEKVDKFNQEFGEETLKGFKSLEKFVNSLKAPRKIILMVKAGPAIDTVIQQLTPLLDQEDIIIDGGNSHYKDSARREEELAEKGFNFIGMGISGGEEGALEGPSMMPGGKKEAYEKLEEILIPAAADDGLGGKCIDYIGSGGSGHFVKMVHNGIEYAIMQLIAEIYDILKNLGNLSNEELAETFENYNQPLNSFLLEITAKIFSKKDPETGQGLIDLIKDTAKQKGTGKWTTIAALDYGVSTPTINAAVDARIVSGDHDLRQRRQSLPERLIESINTASKEALISMCYEALEAATICSYAQGFELIEKAKQEYNWNLNLSEIARIWRGGCIIRSNYLEDFQAIYNANPATQKEAKEKIIDKFNSDLQNNWRKIISLSQAKGIPIPCLSASLAYYDSIRREKLPQNLTQAQRDFFGAHTYQRLDKEGTFHTEWEE